MRGAHRDSFGGSGGCGAFPAPWYAAHNPREGRAGVLLRNVRRQGLRRLRPGDDGGAEEGSSGGAAGISALVGACGRLRTLSAGVPEATSLTTGPSCERQGVSHMPIRFILSFIEPLALRYDKRYQISQCVSRCTNKSHHVEKLQRRILRCAQHNQDGASILRFSL